MKEITLTKEITKNNNLFLTVGCVMLEMTYQINSKKTRHILCMVLKWFISYMYHYAFLCKCKCTANQAYVSYTRVSSAVLIGIINVVVNVVVVIVIIIMAIILKSV